MVTRYYVSRQFEYHNLYYRVYWVMSMSHHTDSIQIPWFIRKLLNLLKNCLKNRNIFETFFPLDSTKRYTIISVPWKAICLWHCFNHLTHIANPKSCSDMFAELKYSNMILKIMLTNIKTYWSYFSFSQQ